MTFNKCSINGKAYGDPVDEHGNPMDVTSVSFFMHILITAVTYDCGIHEEYLIAGGSVMIFRGSVTADFHATSLKIKPCVYPSHVGSCFFLCH